MYEDEYGIPLKLNHELKTMKEAEDYFKRLEKVAQVSYPAFSRILIFIYKIILFIKSKKDQLLKLISTINCKLSLTLIFIIIIKF